MSPLAPSNRNFSQHGRAEHLKLPSHLGGINDEASTQIRTITPIPHTDGDQQDALVGYIVL